MFKLEFPNQDGKALDSATLSHALRQIADQLDTGNLAHGQLIRDHNGRVIGEFWYEVES